MIETTVPDISTTSSADTLVDALLNVPEAAVAADVRAPTAGSPETAPPPSGSGSENDATDGSDGFTVHDRRFWAHADQDGEAAPEPAPRKTSFVEQLEQKIASQEATLREYIDAHKAAAQRFAEARVRMRAHIDEEIQQEKSQLLTRFFDVLDNLQRTTEAAEKDDSADSHFAALRDGMRIVERQLDAALASLGLVRVDPLGQPFDPTVHEAVGVVPVADAAADQTVYQVMRCGYRQGERMLRPAMVLVARHSG